MPIPWQNAVSRGSIRFAADLVPILTKVGCNQGACHGAAAGQNGFRLSLRGGDPSFDWEQITRDANGKRIDKAHPEKSLVFLKPTGQVPHGGGQRFNPDAPEARVLRCWTGFEAQTPDSVPLAGPMPGMSNLFVLCCVRSGYTIGPYIGRLMGDLMLGREPEMPLFDPARLLKATAK